MMQVPIIPDMLLPWVGVGLPVVDQFGYRRAVTYRIGDIVGTVETSSLISVSLVELRLQDLAIDLRQRIGRRVIIDWLSSDGGNPYAFATWAEPRLTVRKKPAGLKVLDLGPGLYATGEASQCTGSRAALWVVPEIQALDVADPRLLDDGTRWVDAEALRLLALHASKQQTSWRTS